MKDGRAVLADDELSVALLPCPYCGCEECRVEARIFGEWVGVIEEAERYKDYLKHCDGRPLTRVYCPNCDAARYSNSISKVAAKWNTRAYIKVGGCEYCNRFTVGNTEELANKTLSYEECDFLNPSPVLTWLPTFDVPGRVCYLPCLSIEAYDREGFDEDVFVKVKHCPMCGRELPIISEVKR